MKKKYRELKELLLKRYPFCEVCGLELSSQMDHALYHIHGHIYDSIENCRACCPNCNTGYGQNANSREAKKKHWAKRCAELGKKHMDEWNLQVPKWRREGFDE